MQQFVIWNGKLCREEEVKIPLNDRGFLFGDGVFTTIKIEHGQPEALKRHLEKLECQCRDIGIAKPVVKVQWIEELVLKHHAQEGVWRLKIIATGGNAEILRLPAKRKGQLILTLKPYAGPSYTPLKLGLFPFPTHTSLSGLKSLAYLERLLIKEDAARRKFDDCLVKDSQGHLLETAFANLFWRRGGKIYIPDPELPYYFGASLERVICSAKDCHFIKAKRIPGNAQVYLCNSMIGICPVVRIEEQTYARDPDFERQFRKTYERVL
jgi:4-amino-4-deoxychorismate lyase